MHSINSFIIFLLAFTCLSKVAVSFPLIGIRDDLSSEFVGVGLRDDVTLPIEKRRIEKPSESSFCVEHRQTYENYCSNFWTDRSSRMQTVLFSFCPGYENKCLH